MHVIKQYMYQGIHGGYPTLSQPTTIGITTTEAGLDMLILPAFPGKPIPPFIKHTIEEDKEVNVGPKGY